MSEYFKSPYSTATSASVEGDFSELKNKILRHDFKPMTADRFVITHLNNLKSSMTIARSEQLFPKSPKKELDDNYEYTKRIKINWERRSSSCSLDSMNNTIQPDSWMDFDDDQNMKFIEFDDNIDDHNLICNKMSPYSTSSSRSCDSIDTLKEEESWMGLKNITNGPFEKNKKKITRPTKYTKPCQDIDRILNSSRMRSHKKTILLNGNISNQCKIKKDVYMVTNTCAFDAIAVAIAVAYNDNNSYKQYINDCENLFLQFSKDLAIQGPNKIIYRRRVDLLLMHFNKSEIYPKVQTINCECNVTKIIQSYLKDEPSATECISCNKCGYITRPSPTIILPSNSDIIQLQTLLNAYTENRDSKCSKCGDIKISSRVLGEHIFIETDFFTTPIQLQHIPKKLNTK